MKVIIHSVLVFAAIFILYNALCLLLPNFHNTGFNQSYWQENAIKAENFSTLDSRPYCVIAGSSMSSHLFDHHTNQGIYNLAFIGGSSLTGLELIKRSDYLPSVILVEVNWLERPLDADILSSVSNKSLNVLKRKLPGLTETSEPANITLSALNRITPFNTAPEKTTDSAFFNTTLNNNLKDHNGNLDSAQFKASADQLKNYISFFISKGVKVYLLELPVHQMISSSKKYSLMRHSVDGILQSNTVQLIKYAHPQSLRTKDGYHLDDASMNIYSNFLKKTILRNERD